MKSLLAISFTGVLLVLFLTNGGGAFAQGVKFGSPCSNGTDCEEGEYCAIVGEGVSSKTGKNAKVLLCVSCDYPEYPSKGFGCAESGLPGIVSNLDKAAESNQGLVNFIDRVLLITTGVVIGFGLIAFVVGGYLYMTAGGNAQRIGTAKTIIGAALLGIVLAITAQLILNTLSPQFASQVIEPLFRP